MQQEPKIEPISDKTHELVGRACAAWAHFEAVTEAAIWGVLGVDQTLGPIITWPKDIRQMWQLLLSESPKKLLQEDIDFLKRINKQLVDVMKDRNIIVHGLISMMVESKKTYNIGDIVDEGKLTLTPAWTVFKGEHAGKRFVMSEKAIRIILENIQKLAHDMQEFNKKHGYRAQYFPVLPADPTWPKRL